MSKEIDNSEMLAVIYSELKKITTHLKIDRRKQGEEETPISGQDTEIRNQMLRQIAETVKELSERKLFTEEQTNSLNRAITEIGRFFHKDQDDHHAELKLLLEVITAKLDERAEQPQKSTIRHDHTYTVDFKNSKAAITIATLVLTAALSIGINMYQCDRINDQRDDNLKYRYIKMQGKAAAEDLYRLESVFGFDRNKDSIKMIRRQVERYEQLVKEYNEKQLQIRLNDERAREIEEETATVKGKK